MAEALIGGAALGGPFGSAFQEFYALVKHAVKEARLFKRHLKRLQSKLETLNEWVEQITDLNVVVGHKEEETKNFIRLMKEGKELVEKCLKIGKWNPKKLIYGSKLSKFEDDMHKVIDSFVPLFQARNGLEDLAISKDIQTTVNKNLAFSNDTQTTVNKNLAISKDIQTTVNKNLAFSKDIQTAVNKNLAFSNDIQNTVNKNLAVSNDIQTTVNKIYEGQNLGLRNGGLSCVVPPPPNFTIGLDVHIKGLKRKLLIEKIPLLVLTAPGGCGKTTLVKKLCQDEDIKGVFKENIFFVHVSETPNLKVIACDLFSHKGHQVPPFQSDEDAVNRVGALFKLIKDPILLIMDDVWSKSEYLVNKLKFDISNYQILVTSRIVIRGYKSVYILPLLNDEHAKGLLYQSAELKVGTSLIPSKYIEKVLRACGGYPLALEVIGRSLCGLSSEAWRSWVVKQSQGHLTLGFSNELLNCLQRSLDVLPNNMKECFLDLGLFPKDKRIPVRTLIGMWTELYNLHEDGFDAIEIIDKINSQNLASLYRTRKDVFDIDKDYSEDFIIDIDKDYSKDFVLQHDLLRELAVHQSNQGPIEQRKRLIVDIRKEIIPNWLSEYKSLPIKAQILSITTDEKFSLSWCNIQPSEVELLVLNFQTENSILFKVLPKMPMLKVLIVTNYGFSCVELNNFQLFEFTPYLRKIILKNVSIPSLFMCSNGQAFGNCNIKISNAFPNLVDIDIDFCNYLVELPIGLCEVTCLKILNITGSNLSTLPQRLGELTNLEVFKLRYGTHLLGLPESITSLHKLNILDISSCLEIIKLPEHIGDLKNLKVLRLRSCHSLLELPESTTNLHKLSILDISCNKIIKLPEHIGDLNNLEVLRLGSCFSLLGLPESITGLHKLNILDMFKCMKITKLPKHIGNLKNLEVLRLKSCSSLLELPESIKSLYRLSILDISYCDEISKLPEHIGDLRNLEVLRLNYCYSLWELPESIKRLHKLRILDMSCCKSIFKLPEHIGDLKNLEMLRLKSCILVVFPESITSLHKLSTLDISLCMEIIKLPEHIGKLCNLKELHMEGCRSLHKQLPPSTFDLKLLELVTCDNQGAKLWEPIKKELTNLQVKVVPNIRRNPYIKFARKALSTLSEGY